MPNWILSDSEWYDLIFEKYLPPENFSWKGNFSFAINYYCCTDFSEYVGFLISVLIKRRKDKVPTNAFLRMWKKRKYIHGALYSHLPGHPLSEYLSSRPIFQKAFCSRRKNTQFCSTLKDQQNLHIKENFRRKNNKHCKSSKLPWHHNLEVTFPP